MATSYILVVDDDADIEPLFNQVFKDDINAKKIDLTFASNGEEALHILEERPDINLILSDINMPKMDGISLLKQINAINDNRQDESIRKVVIFSAYNDMKNIRAAMNERAFDFITKPIDIKDLKITLDKTLNEIQKINNHILEKRQFRVEKESLSRYFSEDIVGRILAENFHEKMLGEIEIATILFLDIRDFTSISETLTPDKVADLLNRIYPDFMELILSHGGSVNKLIGDALVATFGLPIGSDDDTYNAVKTAMEIIRWVEMFEKIKPDYLGEQEIKIGIGITTGEVFAGNIGSFRRLEYTVIGDIVNIASRLQNLTKKVGVSVLIDGETKKRLGDLVKTRQVRVKSIRGKKERVEIFTVDDLQRKVNDDVDYF